MLQYASIESPELISYIKHTKHVDRDLQSAATRSARRYRWRTLLAIYAGHGACPVHSIKGGSIIVSGVGTRVLVVSRDAALGHSSTSIIRS